MRKVAWCFLFFFFNATATTEIYTLSLHDALPIFQVLDLSSSWPSNMDMCAEWNEIPKSAPNLEILILSRNICHPMDRLCENVVQFTPRLFSLIGVLCRENSALPPSLRYITHQSEEHRRACLKRKSGYELKRPFLVMKQGLSWRRVAKDGPCWNEAFGTSYFFPNSDLQYHGWRLTSSFHSCYGPSPTFLIHHILLIHQATGLSMTYLPISLLLRWWLKKTFFLYYCFNDTFMLATGTTHDK